MIYRTWPGKHLLLALTIMVAALSCQKPDTEEAPTEVPPTIATFESLFEFPTKSFCGSQFTSPLKVKDGKNIGNVKVANDDLYLYLTYTLEQNWYLVDVQTFAGTESLIPKTGDGSPNHGRFPGKQGLSPCDMKQTFTFRVALSSLNNESEADCARRLFIAMRASVRHIANVGACTSGLDEEAWAAPILINPNKNSEWATAFYYCLQDCPPPPPAWCAFGQGYWFASGKHPWDNDVVFGLLKVSESEGMKMWGTGKRTTLEKAFFQAAALQLSQKKLHPNEPIPASIKAQYDIIANALSGYTETAELQSAQLTAEKEKEIQDAAGAIGKWICANNCNLVEDPTACTQ